MSAIQLVDVIKDFTSPGNKPSIRAVDAVSLGIEDGEFFALLGPSGCGKTTTLRMIAGFEEPTAGKILIRGQEVQNVPPFHRPVNTVFQDYALFPHMTVLDNVMFGLQMEKVPKKEARKRAFEALELVQLPDIGTRKPRQLSGGQQQRVALARALVKQPAVLLLDEPLGALDLKLRKDMQYELKTMQQRIGITFIYVTHDQEEAMTMADRIAVMNQGKVLQIGNPVEIYESPAERFVADFIGETNFIEANLIQQNHEYGDAKISEKLTIQAVLPNETLANQSSVSVAIRPEKVGVFPLSGEIQRADGTSTVANEFKTHLESSNTTIVRGILEEALYIGTDTRYTVSIGGNAKLVARVQNFGHSFDTMLRTGQEVYVYWDTSSARILAR